ncbi:MAG: hypothetical protein U0996_08685 [Planctomycetaceae bacterium]
MSLKPRSLVVTAAMFAMTGCAEFSLTGRIDSEIQPQPAASPVRAIGDSSGKFSELKAGQQVRIAALATAPHEIVPGETPEVIQYCGTVESLDQSRIILSQASIIAERSVGSPIVNKVPYVNRLLKNAEQPAQLQALLPHGIVIQRSQIVSVQPNIDAPYERIGVDFDFAQ